MNAPVNAIELDGIRKTYTSRNGTVVSLDGVSFEVASHEFVSVLGPSGCGKTTILRMIAGLSSPTSGTLKVDGRKTTGPQQKIGIVFQVPALMRWRKVLENLLLPIEILGRDRKVATSHALELLKLVGLSEFADKYPHELSGGMQQRVAIARALVHDPEILLLDEPFSALDSMTRNQLNLDLLRIWSQKKKTSLLITHSIPEAVFLSDRVVVLGPRPAKVLDIVAIKLPRPRTPEMRVSAPFIEIVDRIGRLIGLEYA
ncbi:ABC transporter ATP-binding protein [Bradyrhizobium sp. dw_411]|uniref:ABC transporter ATP-binding protein n=1 Tax=Bradyrhizobium sp. dw_411 TaxID=2720082 RepID=UPI001BCFEDF0|nr:ABC transporter ATP-binding protein [Bradyrhizobium sp. dw_411]